jgi:hypothetical protein
VRLAHFEKLEHLVNIVNEMSVFPQVRLLPNAENFRAISFENQKYVLYVLWFAGSNFLLAGKERKERLRHLAHDPRRERIFSIWIRRNPLKRPVSDE